MRLAVLVHEAGFTVVSPTRICRIRGLLARDHAEQGGLAGAVGADHTDDAAGGQVETEVVDQQPYRRTLGQALGLDDQVAEARPGGNEDLDLVAVLLAVLRGAASRRR
jgi:hypothetical protein